MSNETESHPYMHNMYGVSNQPKKLSETIHVSNGDKILVSFTYDETDEAITDVKVSIFSKERNMYVNVTQLFSIDLLNGFIDNIIDQTINSSR